MTDDLPTPAVRAAVPGSTGAEGPLFTVDQMREYRATGRITPALVDVVNGIAHYSGPTDLFWHAFNYRNAGPQEAHGCWLALVACVQRIADLSRHAK